MIIPGVRKGFTICVEQNLEHWRVEAVVWSGKFAVSFPWRDDKWNEQKTIEAMDRIDSWRNNGIQSY